MKAFSCAVQETSLPPRRETTTLLVPTSTPRGCEPGLIRSSSFSGASSGAFQTWSLFSVISLSSAWCAPRLLCVGARLLGLQRIRGGLLGQPAIVAARPLPAQLGERKAL